MKFWEFCHETLGLHVYVFLCICLLVIMCVCALVHMLCQKRREDQYADKFFAEADELNDSALSAVTEMAEMAEEKSQ